MSNVLPLEPPRTTIQITAELHEVVDAAVHALRHDSDLFHRDGVLVRVVRSDGDDVAWTPGAPQIRNVVAATMAERLTSAAKFQRFDGRSRKWIHATPTSAVVDAVLARGNWPGLRALVGVLETPSMRHDGTLLDVPGYDRATGYLYLPNANYIPPPLRPTRDDAVAALAELIEVFADFPYAKPEHGLVPIAAILTLIARPMIRGACPAFLFDATTPGSGKSLQSDAVALVATGRAAARMTYPPSDEEIEKVLSGYAMYGARIVPFDNVTRPFGAGPLDKILTALDRVELRELGKSQIHSLPWRAIILASGNNLAVIGDTSRRVLLSRLEPACERPQDRANFRHPNLLAWVAQVRPRLVRAALTLLLAWAQAGRPQGDVKRWGSYEAWAETIPPALLFAGAPDVLAARLDQGETQDPSVGALRTLLAALRRIDPDRRGVTAKGLIALLYPPQDHRAGPPMPDGYDDAREAVEVLVTTPSGRTPDAKGLGYAFRKLRGRILGGMRLATVAALNRDGAVKWTAEECG